MREFNFIFFVKIIFFIIGGGGEEMWNGLYLGYKMNE